MPSAIDDLADLYTDTKTCAKLIGLDYIDSDLEWVRRLRHGRGFTYQDHTGKSIPTSELKKHLAKLVIPPAWQEVWICPSDKGHILVTGIDEKGRKQYIYHPKWRTMRDLIKFYRLMVFAQTLPKVRKSIDRHLAQKEFDRNKIIAAMLWILDNTYIRIGNDIYFQQNESVGLTTLTDKNVVLAGPVITLSFTGKSGKPQQITLEDMQIAGILRDLCKVKGSRLFRYQENKQWREITADDINTYLHDLTGSQISAKDFRTWGGTLIAYMHLIDEYEAEANKKPEKVAVEAIDQAAAVLGNTRAVAKSAYVHPHLLSTYGSRDFAKLYQQAQTHRKISGLDKRETELLYFLVQLFETEFNLLKNAP